MNYHLTIKRSGHHSRSRRDIALDDWLAAVEDDDAFSFVVNEGDSGSAIFDGANSSEQIIWSNGVLDVDSPSEKFLNKVVELADSLDARRTVSLYFC